MNGLHIDESCMQDDFFDDDNQSGMILISVNLQSVSELLMVRGFFYDKDLYDGPMLSCYRFFSKAFDSSRLDVGPAGGIEKCCISMQDRMEQYSCIAVDKVWGKTNADGVVSCCSSWYFGQMLDALDASGNIAHRKVRLICTRYNGLVASFRTAEGMRWSEMTYRMRSHDPTALRYDSRVLVAEPLDVEIPLEDKETKAAIVKPDWGRRMMFLKKESDEVKVNYSFIDDDTDNTSCFSYIPTKTRRPE